jgi:hypothetical protein
MTKSLLLKGVYLRRVVTFSSFLAPVLKTQVCDGFMFGVALLSVLTLRRSTPQPLLKYLTQGRQLSVSVSTPHLRCACRPRIIGSAFERSGQERDRARPDDLIELSASTYIDQLQRYKVLDSEMPYLFRGRAT